MAEQVGYAVLSLRVETLERELKEVKKELKVQARDNAKGFTDINDRVDAIATFTSEVKIMLTNFAQTQTDMKETIKQNQTDVKKMFTDTVTDLKEDIKTIAASAGKDQGWRALLTDIVKLVVLIIVFIVTGKFAF